MSRHAIFAIAAQPAAWLGALLAVAAAATGGAQTPAPAPASPAAARQAPPAQAAGSSSQPAPAATPAGEDGRREKEPTSADRRRAAQLFLESTKLFEKEQFEEAMNGYRKAASLDPSNPNYALSAEVARSHAVSALIQAAAKARMRADVAGARTALAHALELDPKNPQVVEHIEELSDDAARGAEKPFYSAMPGVAEESIEASPSPGRKSFHLKANQRQVIQQVFKGFGLNATLDDSVRSGPIRFDVDDAEFHQAMRALSLLTNTFYVALDPHHVLVARDSSENRQKFIPLELETIYLSGLTTQELNDVTSIAKNVFEINQATVDPSASRLVVRATHDTLIALNATLRQLIEGRNQVLLEVRVIQIAHTSDRNTGAQMPQSLTAFNVYSEEQEILNANASLVQQIISSGLAAPGDTAAIIAILLASGQVSNAIFSNGFLLFGNGLSLSGISPKPVSADFNLNSSDSRELDQLQLRLGDGEAGTVRTGEKYPIMTSSFSGLNAGSLNIPGLNSPGTSAGLGGLAGLLGGGAVPTVPQVQYQDLGLTLKATPRVLRSGDVALSIDMKIDALGGSSLNGVPILDNRAWSGVVSARAGEAVAMVSELDKQESLAISGVPGLSEIPGLNDITDKDKNKSYSTLVIVMTPHVVRGTQPAGHTPMMHVEPASRPR